MGLLTRIAPVAFALAVVGLLLPSGPALADRAGLRITQVDALCECGYIFMPWGWGETRVKFSDPTRVPGHTYKLVVSPHRPAVAQKRHSSFRFLESDAKFKVGHTYTFRVKEYDGSRLVESSPPYRWTPQNVGTPSAMSVASTTMSNGVEALVAGITYTLQWTGSWEHGAKVYAEVATMDAQGQPVGRLAGHSDLKPVSDPDAITFTPTADDVGTWVNIRVFGAKAGRVEQGFGGADEFVFPVVANADDVAHAQHLVPSAAVGRLKTTGKTKVGSTMTVTPVIPASSDYLGLTVGYQWYRVNKKGVETDIDGATTSSYTLTRADRGSSLWLRTTYTPSNPDYAVYTEGVYLGDVKP
jgi:hypothetical protein